MLILFVTLIANYKGFTPKFYTCSCPKGGKKSWPTAYSLLSQRLVSFHIFALASQVVISLAQTAYLTSMLFSTFLIVNHNKKENQKVPVVQISLPSYVYKQKQSKPTVEVFLQKQHVCNLTTQHYSFVQTRETSESANCCTFFHSDKISTI